MVLSAGPSLGAANTPHCLDFLNTGQEGLVPSDQCLLSPVFVLCSEKYVMYAGMVAVRKKSLGVL